MWPPCSGTGWTHARAGWVWGATSTTELTKILSPLYIPLVTEGCPWEWGTPLLLIWPRFELLNDGEFMDFFTSSDNGLAVLFFNLHFKRFIVPDFFGPPMPDPPW